MCFERNGGAAIEVGPQNIDQAGSGITFSFSDDPDLGSKPVRALYKLSGGSRMQTEFIRDAHLASDRDRLHVFRQFSCLARAPAPMQKSFDRRKENFIRQQTDDDDHQHDRNDLFHGIQFAAEM